MKTLLLVLFVGLFSCGQTTTVDRNVGKNSISKDSNEKTKSPLIDSALKSYLDTAFKGWTLPEANRWDTLWYNQYKSNGNLVNYVKSDFDCNKEQDYALLFKKADGTLVAYAFLSKNKSFDKFELENLGTDTDEHIEFGLELINAGRVNYMDPESEDSPSVVIKCKAIQVLSFEKGAETFYWEKGKLNSVTTGD